jgi:hypothetical protein
VRRATLALRRRRRVAGVIGKVSELRAAASAGAGAAAREVAEAEVLALLTSLLGDEIVSATTTAAREETASRPQHASNWVAAGVAASSDDYAAAVAAGVGRMDGDGGGGNGGGGNGGEAAAAEARRAGLGAQLAQTSRETIDGVMERLDRLRKGSAGGGGLLAGKGGGSTSEPQDAPPNAAAVPDGPADAEAALSARVEKAAAAAHAARAARAQAPQAAAAGAGAKAPAAVPRLAFDSLPSYGNEAEFYTAATAESGAPEEAGGLLSLLQSRMDTARQSVETARQSVQADVEATRSKMKDTWASFWRQPAAPQYEDVHTPTHDAAIGPNGGPVVGEDGNIKLTRDRGCRNRFSEADWAKRVQDKTVGFGAAGNGATYSMPSGPPPRRAGQGMRSDPDEWTLPPPRPVHALEASMVDRYDAKEHKFAFC